MSLVRLRSVALSVPVVAALLAAAFVSQRAAALPLRQRELGRSGAWSWFGDPRAVYYQGVHRRTYVGWVDGSGNVQVASYDHDTGVRVVATVKANFQIDDHAGPSLLLRPDGHLLAFWSAHIGGAMYYRRSVLPEDVTSWEPERTVPTNTSGTWGFTYPNPVQLSAEGDRIWLFWRGANFNPTFSTSDDGSSWGPARTLISVPGQRPYVKYASNSVDTIHLAFTQGHPRDLVTNIYYARYGAGGLYRADGSLIAQESALPFTPAQADMVYDAAAHGGVKAWVHDVGFDAAGRPVVVFATFPSNSDHRYHYARWDGTGWVDHEFALAGGSMSGDPTEPNYSGGVTLDHEDPSVVFLARQRSGVFEVELWQTSDGGHSWSSRSVTSGSARGNYRPISPRGMTGADLNVVWMRGGYPSYTSYQTAIDVEALSHDAYSPAAVAPATGQLDVLARDMVTSELLHWWCDGSWHGPARAAPTPGGAFIPSVAAWGPNRLDVFAVTAQGRLAHAYNDGGWHAWESLGAGPGGAAYQAPAAVASWGYRRLDVFAATSGGRALAHRWFDGVGASAWLGPETLSAGTGPDRLPLAGMAAASWAERRLDVFSTDASLHGLLHTWFDGGWHGPEHLDFAGAAAVVLADSSPRTTPIPVDSRVRRLPDGD